MHEHEGNADIEHLSQRLRAERPELSAGGSSAVKQRVERRVSRTSSTSRASSALVAACLGFGLLFSGGGTALAVSGLSSDGTAVSRQYPQVGAPQAPAGEQPPGGSPTVGGEETPGGDTPATSGGDDGDVAGESASGGDDSSGTTKSNSADSDGTVAGTETSTANPTGQIAATEGANGQLPFTGFAAIPVLLLGASLLLIGLTLRRRARTEV